MSEKKVRPPFNYSVMLFAVFNFILLLIIYKMQISNEVEISFYTNWLQGKLA